MEGFGHGCWTIGNQNPPLPNPIGLFMQFFAMSRSGQVAIDGCDGQASSCEPCF